MGCAERVEGEADDLFDRLALLVERSDRHFGIVAALRTQLERGGAAVAIHRNQGGSGHDRFLSACVGRQRDFGLALLNDETALTWWRKVPQRVGQKVLQSVCL